MAWPQERHNPPPPWKCRHGKKIQDQLSGEFTYMDFTVINDDGWRVDARSRATLDDRPDLQRGGRTTFTTNTTFSGYTTMSGYPAGHR